MKEEIIVIFVFAWMVSLPYMLRMLKRFCRKAFEMMVNAVLNWIDAWNDVFSDDS